MSRARPQTKYFDAACVRCSRLASFLEQVREAKPGYYGRPVPSFGDPNARLLVVGLAPGMHGANRTGRPFTGDHAGILLYETLHEFGYASQAESVSANDSLALSDCRIANAVKCLPPQNKPTTDEVKNCNPYIAAEILSMEPGSVVLALGSLAHGAILRALGLKLAAYRFAHAAVFPLTDGLTLVDSYHCSRYNTQTRRLTPSMFKQVFSIATEIIKKQ